MKATLVFPKKDTTVLLAKKVRKIGAGKWNAFGGKPELKDLSIRHTACRELFQESGKGISASPEDLQPKALIDFFLFQNTSNEPDWSVAIYVVENFSGKIKDTDEMVDATWFPIDSIPYDNMLPADRDFIPKIFEGDTFKGKVRFNEDMTAVMESEYTNTEIDI